MMVGDEGRTNLIEQWDDIYFACAGERWASYPTHSERWKGIRRWYLAGAIAFRRAQINICNLHPVESSARDLLLDELHDEVVIAIEEMPANE